MFASKKFVEDQIAAVLEQYSEDIDKVTESIADDIDGVGADLEGLRAADRQSHANLLLVTEILLKQRLHNADVMEHVAEMQAIVDDLQQQVDALTPKPVKAPVKKPTTSTKRPQTPHLNVENAAKTAISAAKKTAVGNHPKGA